MLDGALRDALIGLRRSRRFFVTVTVSLGLSVGGVVGAAGLLHVIALRPLAVPNPGELVAVYPAVGEALLGIPGATLDELKRVQRPFSSMCGVSRGVVAVEVSHGISRRSYESVDGDCARTLEIRPTLGRLIGPEDMAATTSAAPVVVLSYRFWKGVYGGDPAVLGTSLKFQGRPLTVIGVGPAGFGGLTVDQGPDLTVPLGLLAQPGGRVLALWSVGRLNAGTTFDEARATMAGLWPIVYRETNPLNVGQPVPRASTAEALRVISVSHGFSDVRVRYSHALYWLTALAILLWVLTCINVGGLFLVRTFAREREFQIRVALGASRQRLVARLFVESLLLAGAAAALAVTVGSGLTRVLFATVWTSSVPSTVDLSPDFVMLATAAGLSFLTTTFVSLGPITLVAVRRWSSPLSGRTTTSATPLWRRAVLAAQVAVSFVLLFSALSFASSLNGLRRIDPGYARSEVVYARLDPLPGAAFDDANAYLAALLDRAAAMPGVEASAVSLAFPAAEVRHVEALTPSFRAESAEAGSEFAAATDWVSPDFFRAAGMSLVAGRSFTWDDTVDRTQVVIVTARMASLLFPDGEAVGRRLRFPAGRTATVVGVVADATAGDPRIVAFPRVYVPILQEPRRSLGVNLILRAKRPIGPPEVRAAIGPLGKQSVTLVRSASEQTELFLARERLMSNVAMMFASIAAMMLVVGLYGLLSYVVAQRRREIGVRLALGAKRHRIAWLTVSEAVVVGAMGLALGLPAALYVLSASSDLIVDGATTGTVALVSTVTLQLVTMVGASLLPTLRAASVDPAEVLRQE